MVRAQNLSAANTRTAGNEIETPAADVALRHHLGLSEQPELATHATSMRAATSGSLGACRLRANSRDRPGNDGRAPTLTRRRVLRRSLRAVVHLDRDELRR